MMVTMSRMGEVMRRMIWMVRLLLPMVPSSPGSTWAFTVDNAQTLGWGGMMGQCHQSYNGQ